MSSPRRCLIDHRTSAGDVCVLTAAFKALHQSNPGAFETDYCGHHGRHQPENNLFANSPYITPFFDGDPSQDVRKQLKGDVQYIMANYGYGIQNAGRPFHFLSGFVDDLAKQLGVYIELKDFRGDIYLSDEERQPFPNIPAEGYWIIDAGTKHDFTAKGWSVHRFQEVVNATRGKVEWVQIGSAADIHTPLQGVHDLIGKTSLRQLCQVMHRAAGVLTPVSVPMHLAAAVPMMGEGNEPLPWSIEQIHEYHALRRMAERGLCAAPAPYPTPPPRKCRPCVVLAGSREQAHWERYPGHTMLGTVGKLECGVRNGEACWRSKTVKIDQDDNLCFKALQDEVGQWVPECLHRITVQQVAEAVEAYL